MTRAGKRQCQVLCPVGRKIEGFPLRKFKVNCKCPRNKGKLVENSPVFPLFSGYNKKYHDSDRPVVSHLVPKCVSDQSALPMMSHRRYSDQIKKIVVGLNV